MGVTLEHPNGDPRLGLRVDQRSCDGIGDFDFDLFCIGVPDRESMNALAAQLSAR